MRKKGFRTAWMLALCFLFSATLMAQEKESKIKVKVEKDGKIIVDTTFTADEDFSGKEIKKMIKGLTGEDVWIGLVTGEEGHKFIALEEVEDETEMMIYITKDGDDNKEKKTRKRVKVIKRSDR